jgi:hypothetical protein
MTEHHKVTADPSFMRCILEKDFADHPELWKLVHNSTKGSDGDTRYVRIKVYQLDFFGDPIYVKFVYDDRNKVATCDFDVIGEKALKHIKAGNFDPEKLQEYIVKKDTEKAFEKR